MGEHSVKNKVAAAVDEDLVCNVIGRDVFSCMSTVSHAYRAWYRTRRPCLFLTPPFLVAYIIHSLTTSQQVPLLQHGLQLGQK